MIECSVEIMTTRNTIPSSSSFGDVTSLSNDNNPSPSQSVENQPQVFNHISNAIGDRAVSVGDEKMEPNRPERDTTKIIHHHAPMMDLQSHFSHDGHRIRESDQTVLPYHKSNIQRQSLFSSESEDVRDSKQTTLPTNTGETRLTSTSEVDERPDVFLLTGEKLVLPQSQMTIAQIKMVAAVRLDRLPPEINIIDLKRGSVQYNEFVPWSSMRLQVVVIEAKRDLPFWMDSLVACIETEREDVIPQFIASMHREIPSESSIYESILLESSMKGFTSLIKAILADVYDPTASHDHQVFDEMMDHLARVDKSGNFEIPSHPFLFNGSIPSLSENASYFDQSDPVHLTTDTVSHVMDDLLSKEMNNRSSTSVTAQQIFEEMKDYIDQQRKSEKKKPRIDPVNDAGPSNAVSTKEQKENTDHKEFLDVLGNPRSPSKKFNIDCRDRGGATALALASGHGHPDIVRILLEAQASIEHTDYLGDTALYWAASNGKVPCVKLLLDANANMEHEDEEGCTALCLAAAKGHANVVKILLEKGANTDSASDYYGRTSLCLASCQGHTDIMVQLLEARADIEHIGYFKNTPIAWAAKCGRSSAIELLIAVKAQIDNRDQNERTPIALASEKGHDESVKVLIGANAQLDGTDKYGYTPLTLATMSGKIRVVLLLLTAGASVDQKSPVTGSSALSVASAYGKTDIAHLLIKKNADVNLQDSTGKTPLCLAALHGFSETVSLLLEHKADMEKANYSGGNTPLLCAAENGHLCCVETLLAAGANKDHINQRGETAEFVALKYGYQSILDLVKRNAISLQQMIEDCSFI